MAAQKTKEKEQAFELFLNTNLTLKEIAAMVNVSAKQMGKWAEVDNWELSRTATQNTGPKLIMGWYMQLKQINEEVVKQGGIPNTTQSDSISKITDSIQKLSKRLNLSTYHMVLKEMLEDLQKTDVEAAKTFGPYMLDFLKKKAQKLSNDI